MQKLTLLLTTFGLSMALSASANADDHMSSEPVIAEIYECTLNDGVSPYQVVALGQGDFAAFVADNKLNMNTYLWEAVAINAPYDEADLRWVNYFPTWKDQSKADQLWRQKADKLQAEIFDLITCEKPFFFPMMSIARPPEAQEKPLITQVCNLNDGKSMEDAVAYRTGVIATANKLASTNVGGAIFMPGIGLSTGWDYVAMTTGTPDDMATMMDTVRSGSLGVAIGKAGLENPSTCVTDLHRSHLMVQTQN